MVNLLKVLCMHLWHYETPFVLLMYANENSSKSTIIN
jgi:hypothetical protein